MIGEAGASCLKRSWLEHSFLEQKSWHQLEHSLQLEYSFFKASIEHSKQVDYRNKSIARHQERGCLGKPLTTVNYRVKSNDPNNLVYLK